MTVVIGLLQGATFLSGLPLVIFVSFIRPWQLERTHIKSLLKKHTALHRDRVLYDARVMAELSPISV